jgi:hypothetical protein
MVHHFFGNLQLMFYVTDAMVTLALQEAGHVVKQPIQSGEWADIA